MTDPVTTVEGAASALAEAVPKTPKITPSNQATATNPLMIKKRTSREPATSRAIRLCPSAWEAIAGTHGSAAGISARDRSSSVRATRPPRDQPSPPGADQPLNGELLYRHAK
ncbi:hypothetical protein Misp02_55150 [Microtetraspora sp. NBRC 16547]|nr:hypothetical protein Misp02_55150 [Microtetraspora sp. NBRC 16547]